MKEKNADRRYTLDARKVKRVQRILKAKSEQAALEEMLDMMIANDRIDRAHKRLVDNGGEIVDTMGRLTRSE